MVHLSIKFIVLKQLNFIIKPTATGRIFNPPLRLCFIIYLTSSHINGNTFEKDDLLLKVFSAALLVLLAASAWAWVVSANLLALNNCLS